MPINCAKNFMSHLLPKIILKRGFFYQLYFICKEMLSEIVILMERKTLFSTSNLMKIFNFLFHSIGIISFDTQNYPF